MKGIDGIEEKFPTEYHKGIIIPLYKKDSKSDSQNNKGLILLCETYKVFTTILNNKLRTYIT